MTKNLLANPGFEAGWSTPVPHQQIPDEWEFGFTQGEYTAGPWKTVQPELRVMLKSQLPPGEWEMFGGEGEHILKLFKGQGAINAWLSQKVSGLVVGQTYRLTVPVYVDTYMWEGEKVPPNTNDPPNERAARLILFAESIRGDTKAIYDEKNVPDWYLHRHVLELDFEATRSVMIVGFEAYNPWPISNNGWFFDELRLEALDDVPEPEPEPVECVPPREPYRRSYVLLPQYADAMEAIKWRNAAAIGTAGTLGTLGHSADDAGVGPAEREIVAVNPHRWANPLEPFFDEHYPGADYRVIEAATPSELALLLLPPLDGDIALAQTDPRWADYDFGEHPGGGTLGEYGCLVTALAMVLRSVYQRSVTPPVMDAILVQALSPYTRDNLLIWSHVKPLFSAFDGWRSATLGACDLGEMLAEGWEVVLERQYESGNQHFVYLERVEGETAHIIDSYDGKRQAHALSEYAGLRALHRADWEPEPAPGPAPPPPVIEPPVSAGPTASFHVQAPVDGLLDYVARVKPAVLKLCHCSGLARSVHQASPETLIVYRKVWNDWRHYIYGYDDMELAAHDFIAWLWPELEEMHDGVDGNPFAIEGLNETIATGAIEDIARAVEFETEFAYQLAYDTPFHALPIVLNTAVGNPEHGAETAMLVPAVQAAIEAGGFVGYHAYWPTNRHHSWLESDWRHFAGRWATSWDETFRERGLRPHYILTEGGPIGDSNHHLNAGAGWRAPTCLNGDWELARDEILVFDELARRSRPGREGRYHGICLFTVGGGHDWRHFAFEREQFESL